MSYCNGLCEHLNEKKHKCELTGEKLSYIKGWWGITHEHVGFLDCDKEESEKDKSAANATNGKNGEDVVRNPVGVLLETKQKTYPGKSFDVRKVNAEDFPLPKINKGSD